MAAPALVRPRVAAEQPRDWEPAARRVLHGAGGYLRVLGAPGAGKTSLLAETAAARIAAGTDPARILLLTTGRRAANAVRAQITRLRTDEGARTIREPLVRTVHSYAFALLRTQASLHGAAPPRLLSGPEQDAVVRELLAGDLELGAAAWPPSLRPALGLPGFAAELRDLLMRSAERGLGPEDLILLGERQERAEWCAAGRFWRQYEQVTALHGESSGVRPTGPALDAAELVSHALLALESDADLLATERQRVRHLLVDDAQHLDPLQFRLVRALGTGAAEFVLAGDPDQAVFSFRGADPQLLTEADPDGRHTVVLGAQHRMASAVAEVAGTLAAGLPGAGASRIEPAAPVDPTERRGSVRVHVLPTAAAEASWLADQLRRAHLLDEVPWSQMAVLVRSAARSFPVLQRALRAAGVPVSVASDALPLAKQPAVRPLLNLLRCAAEPAVLDAEYAAELISSPLGGADPLALRKLRRGLHRIELASGGQRGSDELLVHALVDNDLLIAMDSAEVAPLRRVAELLATARRLIAEGVGIEQVLWEVWQQSGLERQWLRQADRGGELGARADRELDAVVALFEAAGRYVDRLPRGSIAGFAEYLSAQEIAGDSLAPAAPTSGAVALLTAHAAAGREWTVVAVPGVQEGSWPDLRLRGSLLGVEQLLDVLSGLRKEERVSATAPLLAEERRLLLLAASRARDRLLLSAVRGQDEQPSRFLADLVGHDARDEPALRAPEPGRGLVLPELIGELRAVVCAADGSPERRQLAAHQLAKLARAGVPGAHPDHWYALPEISTEQPLAGKEDTVSVSPSTVDVLNRCPLRWLIERHGGHDPAELPAVTGTLVHSLAQAMAEGADEQQLASALDQAWQSVDAGAPWFSRRERARVEGMLRALRSWLALSRRELREIATEQDFRAELPGATEPNVVVRGRVDRLERDGKGRPVVVDLKTAKTPISKADANEHPQLAAYQLAVALGGFEHLGLASDPGGAQLVFVSKQDARTGAAERQQLALDDEAIKKWIEVVHAVGKASLGPEYQAVENADCARCPARFSCPAQPSGRQVPG
ncbi:superfamily I DNA/RNA helicase [Tamaricihabitans halophyticus]|uniref:DNA 3'-5' helicase n=1 Tax=Tamaricihabitans halophyticus TaxID=1262583 RepID=A0A4R2R245_9PSEU|nr:ATP-dependent DNA helicase [Tamaricihabitans halophyticus]TCP56087.1 superfamily I DNA/RNA helicase [Tamaricihabitans halophyticus]